MTRSRFLGEERRDMVLALGSALAYLASAIIDPLLSLGVLFAFLGAVAFLALRSHFKDAKPVPAPAHRN